LALAVQMQLTQPLAHLGAHLLYLA
jgi:hypothetical protein